MSEPLWRQPTPEQRRAAEREALRGLQPPPFQGAEALRMLVDAMRDLGFPEIKPVHLVAHIRELENSGDHTFSGLLLAEEKPTANTRSEDFEKIARAIERDYWPQRTQNLPILMSARELIRWLVESGNLQPGDQVPSAKALSQLTKEISGNTSQLSVYAFRRAAAWLARNECLTDPISRVAGRAARPRFVAHDAQTQAIHQGWDPRARKLYALIREKKELKPGSILTPEAVEELLTGDGETPEKIEITGIITYLTQSGTLVPSGQSGYLITNEDIPIEEQRREARPDPAVEQGTNVGLAMREAEAKIAETDDLSGFTRTSIATASLLAAIREDLAKDTPLLGPGKWLGSIVTIASAYGISHDTFRRVLRSLEDYLDPREIRQGSQRWEAAHLRPDLTLSELPTPQELLKIKSGTRPEAPIDILPLATGEALLKLPDDGNLDIAQAIQQVYIPGKTPGLNVEYRTREFLRWLVESGLIPEEKPLPPMPTLLDYLGDPEISVEWADAVAFHLIKQEELLYFGGRDLFAEAGKQQSFYPGMEPEARIVHDKIRGLGKAQARRNFEPGRQVHSKHLLAETSRPMSLDGQGAVLACLKHCGTVAEAGAILVVTEQDGTYVAAIRDIEIDRAVAALLRGRAALTELPPDPAPRIAASLKAAVDQGWLADGECLGSVKRLADALGRAPSTLRTAIGIAEEEGYLRSKSVRNEHRLYAVNPSTHLSSGAMKSRPSPPR